MALKLSETYRDLIQELFDMEETLDYRIEHDISNKDRWWETNKTIIGVLNGKIEFENNEGESKAIKFNLVRNGVKYKEGLGDVHSFDLSFSSVGDSSSIDTITNDQKAVQILNTLAHIIIDFIKRNPDFFQKHAVSILMFPVANPDDPKDKPGSGSKRGKVYSALVQKHIDKLEGDWEYLGAILKNY